MAQRGNHPFPFDKLLRLIREASKSDGMKLDENDGHRAFIKDSMVLRNRRRVWINSERIISDIEARHTTVRQETGSASTQIRNLTTHKTIFISRDFKEMSEAASVVYFVPDVVNKGQLKGIIDHFGAADQIICIEFQFLDELSGRLFAIGVTRPAKSL